MKSKVLINGTSYSIIGGAANASGTKRIIIFGKTKIGGTGYKIQIVEPVLIVSTSLPGAAVGEQYYAALEAEGGRAGGYDFSLEAGALPAGISLSADGVLSGTPESAGTYEVTFCATDSIGLKGTWQTVITVV